ncbi:MAG: transglutaminase-like domain-containing protein [Oscillospiraceae bacterium]|nr:transglutaminase-like domain-containing protein [Oscillospiraceae bacterium]
MAERWRGALSALSGPRRRAMEFLACHLPDSDLDCYPFELFLQFADHALFLRETNPLCGALDWELFAHYVLSPRVNDEDLSFHRALFYEELWPRVGVLPTAEERVLEVNRWCHEHASYQAQDERTASPLTVFRCGSGRCGEESAFLVSALRSVGIAARQVYAPRWSHCDDNHAWVEALCGGVWRFLGACEPEPALDRGWFNTPASRAMLVHSRLFGEGGSPLHGQPIGREGAVVWYNQTARYAPVREYRFRALADGRPAAGAQFQLQVLNGAGYHTIASLTADGRGEASIQMGLGDLHVLAALDSLRAEGDCVDGAVTLALQGSTEGDSGWRDFDFHAPSPAELCSTELTPAQKRARADVLARGSALRERRVAGYYDGARAAALPGCEDLLQAARGNCEEIHTFLSGENRPARERLVRTLSDKDLRDVPAEVLEDHLAHLPPRPEEMPEDVYWRYAACPRIALEKLTPWRGALTGWLSGWTGGPAQLRHFLRELLQDAGENSYGPLYWPPAAVPEAGACDEKSRDLLLAAALRTLGVPARLRELDGAAEFWQGGAFRPICPEETGELRLTWTGDAPPLYRQNWSLSRRTEAGWAMLTLPDSGWEGVRRTLSLPAGYYRLITSARLPNGNQLASRRELPVKAGEPVSVELRLRSCPLAELLGCTVMPIAPARRLDGSPVPDLFRLDGRPSLLIWLEEGGEPTEHLLGELAGLRNMLAALPLNVAFLLRDGACARHPTLGGLLERWPEVQVFVDDWAYDLEDTARRLTCDPDTPPLAVVCDGAGTAVYGVSGYRVGSAGLLAQIAAHLCE